MTTVALSKVTVAVRFTQVGKLYHFDASNAPDVAPGDFVLVETRRGVQMGEVIRLVDDDPSKHKAIERIATPRELMMQAEWREKEVAALIVCREQAAKMRRYNGVKFVKAEYNYDGSWLTCFFVHESEDEKVDTGPLMNVLRREFANTQVELRQIGPRDVAKLLGGYGACGIPRCCSTFLTDFSPISIRMAKEQGISLTPSEITGMCGRLRCCLIYEYEQYVEARKKLPKRGKRVGTPHGTGKVVDVLPLKQAVVVRTDEGQFEVSKEELIPLEELEALQRKSAAGCSKHDGGGCDCGAKHAAPTESTADADGDAPFDDDVE